MLVISLSCPTNGYCCNDEISAFDRYEFRNSDVVFFQQACAMCVCKCERVRRLRAMTAKTYQAADTDSKTGSTIVETLKQVLHQTWIQAKPQLNL
jgi:hypothetical protein